MNAYWMLQEIRDLVGEASAARWTDASLLTKMNLAHSGLAMGLAGKVGDWLVTETELTPVSGVVTLPTDCLKVVAMEGVSQEGSIAFDVDLARRWSTRVTGYRNSGVLAGAYVQAGTVVLNTDGWTGNVKLFYQKRVKELHAGTAGASSGVSALVFDSANRPKRVNDYYNNLTVEVVDGTGTGIVTTISDYVGSTMTATLTGTCASGDHYGTVSELPEECMQVVILDAALAALGSPGAALDPKYFAYLVGRLGAAKRSVEEWLESRVSGPQGVRLTIQEDW